MIKLKHNLGSILRQKGWTGTQLSKVSGVPKTTIGEYLTGRKSVRNLDSLKKVADSLNVTVDDLLFGGSAPEESNDSPLQEHLTPSTNTLVYTGEFEIQIRRLPKKGKSPEASIEALYKYALDQCSIVTITDPKGVITYANSQFCEISKYRADELIGQTHRIVNSGYHSREFFGDLWRTIHSGKIWKGEIKNRAKDGTCYWVYATIIPLFDTQRKISKFLAIRADITRRKELEEQIDQERIKTLHASKMTALREILNDALAVCQERFFFEGIEIKIAEIPDQKIECRSRQISNVLFNLLNNSRDAVLTLDERWIEIDIRVIENFVRVSVTDSGNGIPKEISDKVFQPFFTTKEAGKGVGLGLSVSKKTIEASGGRLWLDSSSKHTRFVIDLPLKPTGSIFILDFEDALERLKQWKNGLISRFTQGASAMDLTHFSHSCYALLWEWLRAKESEFFRYPEYAGLQENLLALNLEVDQLIKKSCAGESVLPDLLNSETSRFSYLSQELVLLIARLRRKAQPSR